MMGENTITKQLLEAANFIKRYCRDYGCDNCPFYAKHCDGCLIYDAPDTWYIPEEDGEM